MKKKNLLGVFLLAAAGFFGSCSSDDNNSNVSLEGEWKAETLSYDIPGVHSGTFDFDDPMVKQGCATDFLTIKSGGIAELTENNKVDENCIDEVIDGTWTNETVTISGEETPRQISSVSSDELVLIYPFTFMGQQTDVTVTYSRQ